MVELLARVLFFAVMIVVTYLFFCSLDSMKEEAIFMEFGPEAFRARARFTDDGEKDICQQTEENIPHEVHA